MAKNLARMLACLAMLGVVVMLAPRADAIAFPAPGGVPERFGFGPDSGAEIFFPVMGAVAIEIFDPIGNAIGGEFGFFYLSDPLTTIPIFDVGDVGIIEVALVDFDAGTVFDVEDGVLQNVFAPTVDFIGLYVAFPGVFLTTIAALNPGGIDFAGVFPALGGLGNLIVFEEPSEGFTLTIHFLSCTVLPLVPPVEPVIPEPATMSLVGLGLGIVGLSRRRRRA